MSIRSVDLQTTIAQTQHAERVNQLEHGQTRTQQQHFAQELEESERDRQEEVQQTGEDEDIRRTDKDGEGGQQGRRKREGAPDEADEELLDEDSGEEFHFIDVRA